MPSNCSRCNPVIRRWSKRFRSTLMFLLLNFATFWAAMYDGHDLMTVAQALIVLNAPLYAYIWAESVKPSKEIETNEIHS